MKCPNLRAFHIYDAVIDCEETFYMFTNKYDLFSSCTKVQKLTFSQYFRPREPFLMAIRFPSLKEMAILNLYTNVYTESFFNLVRLNPQIEKVTVQINNLDLIRPLVHFTPNLKFLYLIRDRLYSPLKFSGSTNGITEEKIALIQKG